MSESEAPEPEKSAPPSKPRRRRWWKRLLLGFGILLLLLVLFHRPLLHFAIVKGAEIFGERAGLKVELEIEGSLFSDVTLRNIRAEAVTEDQPLRRLRLDEIALDYRFWKLVTGKIPSFLTSAELENLELVFDSTLLPETEKPKPLPEDRKDPTLPPLPIPSRIALDTINVRVITEAGDLVVEDFRFILDESQPGVLEWKKIALPDGLTLTDVSAATDLDPGKIELRDLELMDGVALQSLVIHHASYRQRQITLDAKLALAGGEVDLMAGAFADGRQLAVLTDVQAADVKPAALPMGLGDAFDERVALEQLKLHFAGITNDPASWDATLETSLVYAADFLPGVFDVGLQARLREKKLRIAELAVTGPETTVNLTVNGEWEKAMTNLDDWDLKAELALRAKDLTRWSDLATIPMEGSAELDLTAYLEKGNLRFENRLAGEELDIIGYAAKEFGWGLTGEIRMAQLLRGGWPPIQASLNMKAVDFETMGYAADAVTLEAETKDGGKVIEVGKLQVARAEDIVEASGTVAPSNPEAEGAFTMDVDWSADIPDLKALATAALEDEPARLPVGSLKGEGRFAIDPEGMSGDVDLSGTGLGLGEFQTKSLAIKGEFTPENIELQEFRWEIDETNKFDLNANLGLGESPTFKTSSSIALPSLAVFNPLLKELGVASTLSGKAGVSVQLEGDPYDLDTYDGTTSLELDNVSFDAVKGARLNGSIRIGTGSIVIEVLKAEALDYQLEVKGRLDRQGFELQNLTLQRGDLRLATANGVLPWVMGEEGLKLHPSEPLEFVIVAEDLNIGRLLRALEQEPIASGELNLNVRLAGTPEQLTGSIRLRGRNLAAQAVSQIRPADLELDIDLGGGRLTLRTVVRQPQLQPLTLNANIPFVLADVLENGFDMNTALSAQLRLPATSLNVLTELVPLVRTADGTAALDINLAGTVAQPTLDGAVRVEMKALRVRNPLLPLITGLEINLGFTRDSLQIRQFTGELAGGPFNIGGSIEFADLTKPVLDVSVKADQILVLRNDMVTARANADVSLAGPLDAVRVSGAVGLTKGRFFKEIEILPLTLPGRPAPNQYEWDNYIVFSFPQIPDWQFDLRLGTDDPFLIRSNLARGEMVADLQLRGTGLKPLLSGDVTVQRFETTLPFSRMEFRDATLTFTPQLPLQPVVIATGIARIRDYIVRASITGRLPTPSVVFSSDPPLPEEDIVSLIATGATVSELQSGGEVLVGRAALLIFQRVARLIIPSQRGQNEDVAEFLDKLSVQIGGLDPRTGKQSASIRFRATDNIILVGDLDVEGEFRGQVKYVIRFK